MPDTIGEVPVAFIRTVALVLGLLWGSFLNVVIYRAPRGMSVVHPPSTCPGCGALIKPYDNVPVLSWLVLRGKARCCGVAISVRVPARRADGRAPLAGDHRRSSSVACRPIRRRVLRAGAIFLADFTLVLSLVAAAFIDAEHMYLPDPVTLGGTVLGLFTASLRGEGLRDAFTGAFVGFVMVWLPFIVVYPRLRGRQGMGLGDAKLTMLAGAWFGWPGAVFVLMAGAIQGTPRCDRDLPDRREDRGARGRSRGPRGAPEGCGRRGPRGGADPRRRPSRRGTRRGQSRPGDCRSGRS